MKRTNKKKKVPFSSEKLLNSKVSKDKRDKCDSASIGDHKNSSSITSKDPLPKQDDEIVNNKRGYENEEEVPSTTTISAADAPSPNSTRKPMTNILYSYPLPNFENTKLRPPKNEERDHPQSFQLHNFSVRPNQYRITDCVKKCQVCDESCELACKVCQKVFYCSKSHQVSDWSRHKTDCFPAVFLQNEKGETIMVATKDIPQGERILKERPFLIVPSTKEPLDNICLGCCEQVDRSVCCSKCNWDICSEGCETDSLHTEFECKIFSSKQVLPPFSGNAVQLLDAVAVLRILLMKKSDPQKWAWFTSLNSEFIRDPLPMTELQQRLSCQSIIQFILDDCQLKKQFDEGMIERAYRVYMLNRMHVPDIPTSSSSSKDTRRASLLFKNFTVPGTSCIPNARWAIGGRKTKKYSGIMGASIDIKKGDELHCDYSQTLAGTYIRRQMIRTFRGRDCQCCRCRDPTECQTYLTALKCRDNPDCHRGTILPVNPLDNCTLWKCDRCGDTVDSANVVTTINRITSELASIGKGGEVDEGTIRDLDSAIKKYKGTILHENHFLIMAAQFDYCHRVVQLSSQLAICDMKVYWGDKVVEFAKELLVVTEKIMPGFHRYKGRALYCLQMGLLTSLFGMKSSSVKKRATGVVKRYRQKKYEEALDAQRLAVKFLDFEPDDSEEGELVAILRCELDHSRLAGVD